MDHEDNVATCPVCLEPTEQRGGKPLYSPGGCGNWLHLECAYAMTKSVSCNTNCPHCRARVTLPQAFDMEKVNEITRRIRHEVDAMDALLTPSVSPRVVTPPRATPAVHVSSRTSVPATLRLSASTSVPALATIRISWSTPSPPVLAPPGTSVATPVPSGTPSAALTPSMTPNLVWLPPTTSTPAPEPPMAFVSVSASAGAAPSVPVPNACGRGPHRSPGESNNHSDGISSGWRRQFQQRYNRRYF
jgi:hypothetical protein